MSLAALECACVVLLSLIATITADCSNPQPLVDSVPDNSFTASLASEDDHPPSLAKLSADDAWCSVEIDDLTISPYIKVNFDSPVEINTVTVGGHTAYHLLIIPYNEYIVNYKIKYRPIGGSEQFVTNTNNGTPKIFAREGNVDLQTATLDTPIVTDQLQIQALPGSWSSSYDRICIRFEANGCAYIPPSTSTTTIVSSTTTTSVNSVSSLLTTVIQPALSTTGSSLSSTTISAQMPTASLIIMSSITTEVTSTYLTTFQTTSSSDYTSTSTMQYIESSSSDTQTVITNSALSVAITSTNTVVSIVASSNNLVVYASSSIGIVIFLIAIIAFVIIIVGVTFVIKRRQAGHNNEEAHHKFDNHMYGYSLNDSNSPSHTVNNHMYGYSLNDPDSLSHKLPATNNVNETTFGSGNLYESIDNILVNGESGMLQSNGTKEGYGYEQLKTTENVKLEDEFMKKGEMTYETMDDDNQQYETMNAATTTTTTAAVESYDYVDKSYLIKPPPPTVSSEDIHTKSPVAMQTDQGNTESPKLNGAATGYHDVNDETILMSPNPIYNVGELLDQRSHDQTSHVPNPIYGGGASDGHQVKDNVLVLPNYDDMLDNPLYGSGHTKPL